MTKHQLHDEIARVAYGLYEKRGRIGGHAERDWLEAERIVMARKGSEKVEESQSEPATRKPLAQKAVAGKAPAKKTASKRKPAGRKKEKEV